ncbi:MAG TPA: hypothetical protein VE642_01890 [Pyrinomonadaceae bacterium]|jgi:hypothetical protein|nr:hypothetical protein [Pyrinomonadaceae bacterium]
MSTSLNTTQLAFGLFVLDAEGIVLYHRAEPGGRPDDTTELTGRNFCDYVATFDNADELRRRVEGFLRGGGHAESFDFTCHAGGEATTVKVLLARVRERADYGSTKAVLLHLRGA